MTIINGPVRLVKIAGAVQKVAEARTFEAVLAPLDLGRGAAPGSPLENWPVTLGEFPVEAGVVRDDNHRILDESRDGRLVDSLPGDHLVGDAGECRHLGRDRDGWFVERGEDVPDADDAAVGQVVEQGEPGRSMYIVHSGELVVSRLGNSGRVIMAGLQAGDFFGEMTLIEMQNRSATVVAESPTVLYELTARNLYRAPRKIDFNANPGPC